MDIKEKNMDIDALDINDLMTEIDEDEDENVSVVENVKRKGNKKQSNKEYIKMIIFVVLIIMIQLIPINSEKFNLISILIKALLIIAVLFLLFFIKN